MPQSVPIYPTELTARLPLQQDESPDHRSQGGNYVKFQFKGGAADLDRKAWRAHFIGQLLEDHWFKTEVVEDNLEARTEGHGPEIMKKLDLFLISVDSRLLTVS
jgi:hypothetical protein